MEKPILTLEVLPETSQVKELGKELGEAQKQVKEIPQVIQQFRYRTSHRKEVERELDLRITSLKHKYKEDEFAKLVKQASALDAKVRSLREKISKRKRDRNTRFLALSVAEANFLIATGMVYKGERKGMDWGARVEVNENFELQVHPFRDEYTKIIGFQGLEAIQHRVKVLRRQRDDPNALGAYKTNWVNPIFGGEGIVQSDWKEPKNKETWEKAQDYKKKAREFDMRIHFDQDLFWEFGDWLKRNVSLGGIMLPSFRRVKVEKGEAREIGS